MARLPQEKYHLELYDKIWKAKGARFCAYERLKTLHSLSTFTTSLLAAYLIILSLLEPFGLTRIFSLNSNLISFASVSLSIIILVFVQTESANQYNLKSEQFLRCAKELSKIFNKLEIYIEAGLLDTEIVEKISTEYSDVIDKYENHDHVDYEMHKIRCAKDFNLSKLKIKTTLFKIKTCIHCKYHLAIILPPVVFFLFVLIKDAPGATLN